MRTTQTPERLELGRFFTVAARQRDTGQVAPEMFSTAIDAEWHRLLNDAGYADFCSAHAGRLIGHTENKGCGRISWISTYEEMFGSLSETWFTSTDGTVDKQALAHYRETGEVVAEWDCSPTGGDEDVAPSRRPAA
jgi:hypothetical protein